MNWFERYGVLGTYFLTISLIWFLCLTIYTVTEVESQVIGLFAFIFLPVGYILTTFAQYCYYLGFLGECIHKTIVTDFLDEDLREELGLTACSPEALCELKLTAYLRLKHVHAEEAHRMVPFCTRRFDVLAISNSMILYTILSPIVTFLLISIFRPNIFSVDWRHCFIVLMLSIILIGILITSKVILKDQILGVNREIWKLNKEEGGA